jgi:hypothetical protein
MPAFTGTLDEITTPELAWQVFVGRMSPAEWTRSGEETSLDGLIDYLRDAHVLDLSEADEIRIASLLRAHLRANGEES